MRQQIIRSVVSHFRVSSADECSIGRAQRTTRQAGYVWGQYIIAKQMLPSPSLWGWVKYETSWAPFWTALPRAAKAMHEMICCGCTTSCTGRCSCYKKGIVCTARCSCSGHYPGRPKSSSYAAVTLTTLLSCSMYNTASSFIACYCDTHYCDYRSSSSHPSGYVFHLQQSSCFYVEDGGS